MRKVLFVLVALLSIYWPSFATDHNSDLLSLISLTQGDVTPGKVTSVLGQPSKVQENKKKTWWYYSKGTANMVVCWNKRQDGFEKVSFSSGEPKKAAFDDNLSRKLKSGATDLSQAIQLLGTPKDMIIKMSTQEMHYAYQNNVLRLFFRDRKLVDFCLY
jgi:hypothetical protein